MTRQKSALSTVFAFLSPLLLLTGCGWATGGLLGLSSGGSGGGGGSNATPSVGELSLAGSRTSPAIIGFTLTDNESDPVDIRLFVSEPGGAPEPILLEPGEPDLTELATSSTGTRHERRWDFASQIGPGFQPGIMLTVEILSESGRSELPERVSQEVAVDVGNDAPELLGELIVSKEEVVGIAAIEMMLSDSSSDLVTVRLQYDVVGDSPDQGFLPATAVRGTPTDVVVSPTGTSFTYVWDVIADEGFTENDVNLRVTPSDADLAGEIREATLRIDNNSEPIAILNVANFVLNSDRARGIPVAFEIFDGSAATGEPGDDVLLAFQWRRAAESFPALPSDPVEMQEILQDPVRRKELQIATEKPLAFQGITHFASHLPGATAEVRLPTLASSAASLLERDPKSSEVTLQGTLEILRGTSIPSAVELPAGFLENPVATLCAGRTEALILDAPSSGGWRFRRIDHATGEETGPAISDPDAGVPTALARQLDGSVLIATHIGDQWRVQRIDTASGVVTDLIEADGSTEGGAIRGIAALSASSSLITVASSLIRLDYPPGGPLRRSELFSPSTLKGPLLTPWGVAVDPLNPNHVVVAENAADRLLVIELENLTPAEIIANGIGLPGPRAIAFEKPPARILAVTDSDSMDGQHELRAVPFRHASDASGDGMADSEVFEILPSSGLNGTINSISAGADGLRLVTAASTNLLLVGGGTEQLRSVTDYDPRTQTVSVSPPFDPPLTPGGSIRRWRMQRRGPERFSASPEGVSGTFLWDTLDVPDGGEVVFRVVPFDSERGTASSTVKPKVILPRFGRKISTIGGGTTRFGSYDVAIGDIDRDGDLDLVSAGLDGDVLVIFYQTAPGEFTPAPPIGDPNTTPSPRQVELVDLDGDQDLDLVSGNSGVMQADSLTVFLQTDPGEFTLAATLPVTGSFGDLETGDLDSDGDLDLLYVPATEDELTLFFQTAPGTFTAGQPLGDEILTRDPEEAALGDLDGDGDLDIVTFSRDRTQDETLDRITVFFQTGPGQFEPGPSLSDASTTIDLQSVTTADLDGDGDLDILVGAGSPNTLLGNLTLYRQTTPGEFELALVLGDAASTSEPLSVTTGDLDGDGDLDIVNLTDGATLSTFFQTGPWEFTPGPTLGDSVEASTVLTGDLDGDGRLDIVTADTGRNTLSLYFQDHPNDFGPGPELGDSSVTNGPLDITVGDLDGDGDLDLAAVNSQGRNLALFFQSSPGAFLPGPTFDLTQPLSLLSTDFDGDGDLDLVTSQHRAGEQLPTSLRVFTQGAPGEFVESKSVGGQDGAVHFATGDLDGDGDLDLVLANSNSMRLEVFFQTNPGEYIPGPILRGEGITDPPTFVATGDLDQDGDLDIVSADRMGLNVYFQDQPGQFTLGPSLGVVGPNNLAIEDFDGDGDLDILGTGTGGGPFVPLTIFFQTGPGEFSRTATPGAGIFIVPFGLSAADLDADGDVDIAVADLIGNNLPLFFQTNPGVFVLSRFVSAGNTFALPFDVEPIDVEGDGDVDLISTNGFGDSITVFFGGH